MTIGQRIKQRREELGLSQEELAHALGYKNRSSINKIELDKQQLRQEKIVDIAKALKTTPMWIIGVDEEVEQEQQLICDLFERCYGKESYRIVQKFLKLDDHDKGAIEERIEILLESPKYKPEIEKTSKGDSNISQKVI